MKSNFPVRLQALKGWFSLSPFAQSVLSATFSIPRGEVRTYAQVAKMMAKQSGVARYARAFRAVGTVLSKNPYAPFVPCHRVVKSDGTPGDYSGQGGRAGKKRMLAHEGAMEAMEKKRFLRK
jgi:methylated-DNA-[protein]-cysteine S-methyltransferase